jgi:hypothetical protein
LGIVIGLSIPGLSIAARPYLPVAIFLFTFGLFLKLNDQELRDQLRDSGVTTMLIFWAP